jgi:hypothetical protein
VAIDAIAPTLTVAERDTLTDCETTIERGMQTFLEVGNALMTIRNNRLYRAEFGTFEDYCDERWQFSSTHAYRLIDAAAVVELISSPMGEEINISERATRELAPLLDDPEELKAIYEDAVEQTGGAPSAAAIKQARKKRESPEPVNQPESTVSEPGQAEEFVPDQPAVEPDAVLPPPTQTPPSERSPAQRNDSADPVFSDDPDVIERERRARLSHSFSRAVGSLWAVLDPKPVEFVTQTWLPSAAAPDYTVVPHVFEPEGLRTIADHLYSIADHLDSTGSDL